MDKIDLHDRIKQGGEHCNNHMTDTYTSSRSMCVSFVSHLSALRLDRTHLSSAPTDKVHGCEGGALSLASVHALNLVPR
jgi:hypothetical protein